ncbi:MAG: hypothetical protein NZ899_06390 [Thermoguttaceae bacterium]|nr:hypothetical protein [Thermoguttaceae bacterium]MDW8079210.1 hypothetical protein [Thermoguttaceae bacterium]
MGNWQNWLIGSFTILIACCFAMPLYALQQQSPAEVGAPQAPAAQPQSSPTQVQTTTQGQMTEARKRVSEVAEELRNKYPDILSITVGDDKSITVKYLFELPENFEKELREVLLARGVAQLLGELKINPPERVGPRVQDCIDKNAAAVLGAHQLGLAGHELDKVNRLVRITIKAPANKPLPKDMLDRMQRDLSEELDKCEGLIKAGFNVVLAVVEEPPPPPPATPKPPKTEEQPQAPPSPPSPPTVVLCAATPEPCGLLGRLLARLGLGCGWRCIWAPVVLVAQAVPCSAAEVPACCCGCCQSCLCGIGAPRAGVFVSSRTMPMLNAEKLVKSVASFTALARAERLIAYLVERAQQNSGSVLLASAGSASPAAIIPASFGQRNPNTGMLSSWPLRGRIDPNGMGHQLFGQAATLYWGGKYTEALKLLEEGVASSPEDPRLWYYKGLAETALGREKEAKRSFARAIWLHETASPEDQRLVTQALARVQGKARLALEEARLLSAMPAKIAEPPLRQAPKSATAVPKLAVRP